MLRVFFQVTRILDFVELHLEKGADPNVEDRQGLQTKFLLNFAGSHGSQCNKLLDLSPSEQGLENAFKFLARKFCTRVPTAIR
jgi:hypothetical protein